MMYILCQPGEIGVVADIASPSPALIPSRHIAEGFLLEQGAAWSFLL
jgi:hypothetical protein